MLPEQRRGIQRWFVLPFAKYSVYFSAWRASLPRISAPRTASSPSTVSAPRRAPGHSAQTDAEAAPNCCFPPHTLTQTRTAAAFCFNKAHVNISLLGKWAAVPQWQMDEHIKWHVGSGVAALRGVWRLFIKRSWRMRCLQKKKRKKVLIRGRVHVRGSIMCEPAWVALTSCGASGHDSFS